MSIVQWPACIPGGAFVRDHLSGDLIPVRVIEPGEETALDAWDALAALVAGVDAVEAELDAMAEGRLQHLNPTAADPAQAVTDGHVFDLENAALDRHQEALEAVAAQARAMTAPEGGWSNGRGMPPIRRVLDLADDVTGLQAWSGQTKPLQRALRDRLHGL